MKQKNNIISRTNDKPIVWDAFYKNNKQRKPIVIFCHGYKGFKDWGCWDLVAEAFKKANLFFVKFNFSHNGGTMDQPIDFPDLNAFGQNNYTKELNDLDAVINTLLARDTNFNEEIDINNITLIGHSRAGGITTIKTSEDSNISRLITWASICDFGKRSSTTGDLTQWKKQGVKYVENARTKQQMPHYIQFYKDFKANEQRLNIECATKKITVPHLIVHAMDDPSINYIEAENLHSWNTASKLLTITKSDHVFGAIHPWSKQHLPEALQNVVQQTILFIQHKQ